MLGTMAIFFAWTTSIFSRSLAIGPVRLRSIEKDRIAARYRGRGDGIAKFPVASFATRDSVSDGPNRVADAHELAFPVAKIGINGFSRLNRDSDMLVHDRLSSTILWQRHTSTPLAQRVHLTAWQHQKLPAESGIDLHQQHPGKRAVCPPGVILSCKGNVQEHHDDQPDREP